jgi:hypothetical protein
VLDTLEPRVHTLSDESVSPLSGDVQTTSMPGSRWGWTVTMPTQSWEERRRLWALLLCLNGREHRLSFFDWMQPVPVGTVPLAGVTMKNPAPQFGTVLVLATGQPGCTLLRGDWLRLGPLDSSQLVRVVEDATANAAGDMFVQVRHMLRQVVPAGTAVVTNRPRGLFVLAERELAGSPVGGARIAEPFSFSLIEVFSA